MAKIAMLVVVRSCFDESSSWTMSSTDNRNDAASPLGKMKKEKKKNPQSRQENRDCV